jgi:hypothetical protein
MTFLEGVTMTPQNRQAEVMRLALEAWRASWLQDRSVRPHTCIYYGGGDLLLQHGRFYPGRTLPEQYAHLKGAEQRCFENALAAAQENSELSYCEGIYNIGADHYTAHAWCVDPSGGVVELTMPTDDHSIAHGREAHTLMDMLPVDHWGYWGVKFHTDLVAEQLSDEGGFGVLDRCPQDGRYHTEGRDRFPILEWEYQPDRRTVR